MYRFALLAVALALVGCEISDNQRIIPADRTPIGNPAPTAANFQENQKKHQILVGVIDTGVDYNHPLLAPHMNYELDAQGAPIGAGYDYVAQDSWPSPYIVRTGFMDPKASPERKKESETAIKNMTQASESTPELARFLVPTRNVEQEINGGLYHGTHVAGLATYDDVRIGLKGYRVLPRNIIGASMLNAEGVDVVAAQMTQAIDQATKDGVRVVNVSLGITSASKEQGYSEVVALSKKFEAVARRNPGLLIVAAAGNSSAWIDGEVRVNIPCGIKAPNILCVGSLGANHKPSDFTNIVLSGADIVFTLGEDLISTFPTAMLKTENLTALATAKSDEDIQQAIKDLIKDNVAANKDLVSLSGTSMASPIVARAAAQMLATNPSLTPEAVIRELLSTGEPGNIGVMPIRRVKFERPSWYRNLSPSPGILMEEGTASSPSATWTWGAITVPRR